ncbi:MAG: NAD-dependent epimerase/dehydratase family protein [Flavobacterium sp.]|nr:NAD-dependent epimerase/dehydratase family protein [Flavobacterium sp.]
MGHQNSKTLIFIFKKYRPNFVVNLAAQAGVRFSIKNPQTYIDNNITGFLNVLESCKLFPVEHLLYASSSSVYGLNEQTPFHIDHNTDHPISIYASSKKANELMAHTYSHLYKIPTTGLRFFTVYGPWGRPDMALSLFTNSIYNEEPIDVYNFGDMLRDFTYVGDIVQSLKLLLPLYPITHTGVFNPLQPIPSKSSAPYQLFNIGNNTPISLKCFILAIEKKLNKKQ